MAKLNLVNHSYDIEIFYFPKSTRVVLDDAYLFLLDTQGRSETWGQLKDIFSYELLHLLIRDIEKYLEQLYEGSRYMSAVGVKLLLDKLKDEPHQTALVAMAKHAAQAGHWDTYDSLLDQMTDRELELMSV